jgi:hypothetical protein
MGLDDLIGEDSSSSETDKSKSSSTTKRYVAVTRDEFEEALEETKINWHRLDLENVGEWVYQSGHLHNVPSTVVLRTFSTIDKRTNKARGKGKDAIRTVIWDVELGQPVGGRKKTLRIKTWRSNLIPKINELVEEVGQMVIICDRCGSHMVIRENAKTGEEFLGCSSYPDCKNTKQLPD